MKQANRIKALVVVLAASGCTARDPDAVTSAPGQEAEQKTASQSAATVSETPAGATAQSTSVKPDKATNPAAALAVPRGESLEGTLPAEELKALRSSAESLIGEFVGAFSSGNSTTAHSKLISKEAFDKIVAPGFRSILSSSLLAKNQQEVANLVEALADHKVSSWKWKPGKLVKSQPESAFSRELLQITGGTIELDVEGTFVAVFVDQLVRLDDKWIIFQIHNL